MAHSIPDSVALVIESEAGRIVHTGDYKIDHTPVDGIKTDVGKLAEVGNRGVDLLLGDSTNAERPGVTQSERVVGEAFRQIIPARTGRVLISSFASNVHRMQQAIDVAVQVDRKVAVVGRSLRKNINIAPQPRLRRRPRGHDDPDAANRGVPPARADGPVRRQPGRAGLGADPDRVQRPSRGQGRARRHGDHLGQADPGERAAHPRHDQRADEARRRGAARGQRARARLGPRECGRAADDSVRCSGRRP